MTDRVTHTTVFYLFSCPYHSGNETLFLFLKKFHVRTPASNLMIEKNLVALFLGEFDIMER